MAVKETTTKDNFQVCPRIRLVPEHLTKKGLEPPSKHDKLQTTNF